MISVLLGDLNIPVLNGTWGFSLGSSGHIYYMELWSVPSCGAYGVFVGYWFQVWLNGLVTDEVVRLGSTLSIVPLMR